MKNMRFWQKTYLMTLILFVVCLCAGVFFIGFFSQRQSIEAEREKAIAQQQLILSAISADMKKMAAEGRNAFKRLFQTYGTHYESRGFLIEMRGTGGVIYSCLPEFTGERGELEISDEHQNSVIRTVGGSKYLYVASSFSVEDEKFILSVAFNLDEISAQWKNMSKWYVTGCFFISAVLAVFLYFVLRRLSKPIEQLALTAEKFGEGELEIRMEQNGNDEIGNLTRSFNKMAGAMQSHILSLRQAAEQKERLADNLSHEMRTPLTSIRGYAEYVLLSEPGEQERNEILSYIIDECSRMQSMSERLLQLSLMRRGEWEPESVNLSEICRSALFAITPKSDSAKLELSENIENNLIIKGDSVLLESLLINLLDNAVKACGAGDKVELSAARDNEKINVIIEDTGRGMSPDELKKLGEPFYRKDKARSRKDGGAGLGVSLCYEIVRVHGGVLSYESEPGKGTKAILNFTTL